MVSSHGCVPHVPCNGQACDLVVDGKDSGWIPVRTYSGRSMVWLCPGWIPVVFRLKNGRSSPKCVLWRRGGGRRPGFATVHGGATVEKAVAANISIRMESDRTVSVSVVAVQR